MPRANSHSANLPLTMAESFVQKLEDIPGQRVLFLRYKRSGESFLAESFKTNDPECDKLRSPASSGKSISWLEVGTYSRGVTVRQVRDDISETMARVR